jgi:hypothetical protein
MSEMKNFAKRHNESTKKARKTKKKWEKSYKGMGLSERPNKASQSHKK